MFSHDVLPLLIGLLLLLGVWLYQYTGTPHTRSSSQESHRSHVPRRLKPRSPLDCPACCLASDPSSGKEPTQTLVRPWREVKSRRGAPKHVNTEGVACPNRACSCYSISEAQIHAVVSDGRSGKTERIQRWRGLACQTTFSARLHTPRYRLKTPSRQVALVLSAAFGRAGCLCGGTGLWCAPGDHYQMAPAGRIPCSDLAPAHLLSPGDRARPA